VTGKQTIEIGTYPDTPDLITGKIKEFLVCLPTGRQVSTISTTIFIRQVWSW